MKMYFNLLLCIVIAFFSCESKEQLNTNNIAKYNDKSSPIPDNLDLDTLRIIQLTGEYFNENRVNIFHFHDLSTSNEQLVLKKEDSVITIVQIPIFDLGIKNLIVNSIEEIESGFKIKMSWGGGNYLYDIALYFNYINDGFYLVKTTKKTYEVDIERLEKKEKNYVPPIEIDSFKVSNFIKN
jgi:hypothetical protein